MTVNYNNFRAAFLLARLPDPKIEWEHHWVRLKWTPETWDAFVEICKAYDVVFDTQYAHAKVAAGRIPGWIPVALAKFDHLA